MIGIFITEEWINFYKKGMKTWEIRSYPIDYRGEVLLIENKINQVVCKMNLIDCILLTKELWEMNFDKHRVSCSYEDLPYKKNGTAYIWILGNIELCNKKIIIDRPNSKPYIPIIETIDFNNFTPITNKVERIACNFFNETMLLYWIKKNYFALIGIYNLYTRKFLFITNEIKEEEVSYIINQINANDNY